ncbi:hypothetical protein, partial [Streptomyces sp. NPDC044948]|uniref:hypothetical protein n=1 Tax=Streptomyces sp. NPDC044948 TaxID=3157092 RepID=UPI0033CD1B74
MDVPAPGTAPPRAADPDALYEAFEAWAQDRGLTLYPHQELLCCLFGDGIIEPICRIHAEKPCERLEMTLR